MTGARLLGLVATIAGWAYPLAVAAVTVVLRLVGDSWWVGLVLMYLPRWGFALPLVPVAVAVALWGPRRLLLAQAGAALLVLFPLMGLELNLRRPKGADGPIRLLSYNVARGRLDPELLLREIDARDANVVLLQEAHSRRAEVVRAHFAGWNVHQYDEFLLATRFEIREVTKPPRLPGGQFPRFMRYLLGTPLGEVEVVHLHPISPREALNELRSEGAPTERARARFPANANLRTRQVAAAAAVARASTRPLIVAGDTNLPGLSRTLSRELGHLQDGFSLMGRGFGYTFPAHHPWMRIDRVLASHRLRFTRFETGAGQGSDHLSVFATLALR